MEILSIGNDITELKQAQEAAQAADRMKSAFLATMSHELRTPLNSIIGFTGIIMQELAGPLNPEQRKQMTMVQNSSRHLLALINDVLDISKIEAGQLILSFDWFDLCGSIRKLVDELTPQAAKKGLPVRIGMPESIHIKSDQRRVEQIIMNLLSNAVKFTAEGEITVRVFPEGEHVEISVNDTGSGIKAEDILKLFKPFFQIDSGITRRYEGTGLGLSISKRLTELLDGSIRVESTPGKGSTFTLTLPLRKES